MRVLVIDDDEDIVNLLYEYLESRGNIIDSAGDGVSGLHLAVVNDYDVIILDINLPGLNGFDLCQKLRKEARKSTPILMLTSRTSVEEKIDGFGRGADDYLDKPFSVLELEARVQALLRRGKPREENRLSVADLTLDLDTLEVIRQGTRINLSPIHIRLLALLMRESPRIVTRQELENSVWGDDPPDSDSLRAHVYTLRNAIDKPFDTALLHTAPKVGYRLAALD